MYIFEKTFGGEYIWGLGPAPPIPPNEFPPPNVLTLHYLYSILIYRIESPKWIYCRTFNVECTTMKALNVNIQWHCRVIK